MKEVLKSSPTNIDKLSTKNNSRKICNIVNHSRAPEAHENISYTKVDYNIASICIFMGSYITRSDGSSQSLSTNS